MNKQPFPKVRGRPTLSLEAQIIHMLPSVRRPRNSCGTISQKDCPRRGLGVQELLKLF